MKKIALIKFKANTYKVIFAGPDNTTTKSVIKALIKTFNYSYQNDIAVAFVNDNKLELN